ncbi:MAG: DUF2817 domain-containing protein [Bdellovibrionaceae bacterium]|nr:DUF2817 domain-containing protein [Pseudobdellovibrionaceae bacterium]
MNSRYIFTTTSWKKTALGTEIPLSASRPLEEMRAERPILLMGGIHGDEPEGVALAEGTLEWLKSACESGHGEQLAPWVVIPCLNIDGFRKNQRVNGRGVDLNRNYPASNWSPTADKERYFPGPSPGSEPEIQGVVELLQTLRPRLVIHCHSWKPMVVYAGEPGLRDAELLGRASGYKVVDTIGYPTPGSLSQYGWGDLKIPIICIEEQDGLTDLTPIWPRFADGMKSIFLDASLRGAEA